jgi:hypothetical protein
MSTTSARIREDLKQYGLTKTVADVALRVANRAMFLTVLKCVTIETPHPEFLHCDGNYRGRFLEPDLLRKFSPLPEYELSRSFLDRALAKGDECYGFLDGDVLAAYGWYSRTPTETDWRDVVIHFDDEHIYMYKGFTHPKHRGKRLHAVGMSRALEAYVAKGYKGIVSYVEWNNFASLKSCYRMGYTDFGTVYVARLASNYFLHCDAGCSRYGFHLAKEHRRGDTGNTGDAHVVLD